MSYLEVAGRRHAIPVGVFVIGSDSTAQIVLPSTGVSGRHAVIHSTPDGQSAIRLGDDNSVVLVNGVRLGSEPVPLLHGDKIEIGARELHFVDERRSGSTQYLQAIDPGLMAAKPSVRRAATAGTGGRLVSLTDGREYAVSGTSLVIGRDARCDVVVESKNVSRQHAEVVATPNGYMLIDSSTNGTFVNAERISGQYLLKRGDVIRCGEYEFRFYGDVAQPPPVAPEPPVAEPKAPASPTPPRGAAQQLKNTLFGVPAVPRPGAPPQGRPAPSVRPPAAAPKEVPAPFQDRRPGGERAPTPATRPSEPRLLASLMVRSGPLKGKRFPIKVPVINVGRADYNDIVLDVDSVSTIHAKLQRREGIWMLVDLDSTNGTLVDGERVRGEVPLAPGALIRFGEVQTMFEPTDDTVDPQKGSSTRLMGAIRLPTPTQDDDTPGAPKR
ncbi:MAG: FHA domain-containing protein [Gemmatimonadota bacterium]|nr:FHA domain-containing protein [Gemmatimonadota bacterium]